MEGLDLLRKWAATHSARQVGLRTEQPRSTIVQAKAAFHESDILALPQDVSNWSPLQDPDTGALFFMVGMDVVGGPNVIR